MEQALPPVASFSHGQWALAMIAAFCIGASKTGFGGVSMVSVVIMADLLPARQSTGVILPMLLFADVFAVPAFRKHAQWSEIRRVLPAALLGIVAGASIMMLLSDPGRRHDAAFRRIIGGIVLGLALLQYTRRLRPAWFAHLPAASRAFAWTMGALAGVTTMLANAAGPVMSLHMLAAGLPKMELVGTNAWIFLIMNLAKLPFSYRLGLINADSLRLNACLFPAVAGGVFMGRWLLRVVPQRLFEEMLLLFAVIASARLLLE